ncbi:MAG: type VI secretion system baseplate subunit TssG [Proteobacteria bacterium]|nr:type VI secretion system baseplate subunit TssG [Pseudomonadota bacterium]
MAGTYGRPTPDVKTELLNTGPSFSFFQVLRLLKTLCAEQGLNGNEPVIPAHLIKIRPNLSLSFPSSGIASVEQSKNGNFTVTANMLGLYGTGSPLPTFYTEDLMDDEGDDENTVRNVLDVINHRLYELLFSVWSKYRSMVNVLEELDTTSLNRLFSLIGLDEEILKREFEAPEQLLRYTGLFAMKSRSAKGLETLISDSFGGILVHVIQMVERKSRIPEDQICRLGQNISLGVTSNLGREFLTRNGAFRIEIGPLSQKNYRRFVPGSSDFKRLSSLTGLYMNQPLSYDVELIMDKKEKPLTLCLGGKQNSSLGLDTWVYSDEGPEEYRTRFSPDTKAA